MERCNSNSGTTGTGRSQIASTVEDLKKVINLTEQEEKDILEVTKNFMGDAVLRS